jgi:hypothetical protein
MTTRRRAAPPWPPPAAVFNNDMYRFSPANNTWTELSPSGSGPSPRWAMGFASTPDGVLYVFGGAGSSGKEGGQIPLGSWLFAFI